MYVNSLVLQCLHPTYFAFPSPKSYISLHISHNVTLVLLFPIHITIHPFHFAYSHLILPPSTSQYLLNISCILPLHAILCCSLTSETQCVQYYLRSQYYIAYCMYLHSTLRNMSLNFESLPARTHALRHVFHL